ncbi:FAD-binding protein, partial [bacterium]|nr:FAD-binding protein [bacterium]
MQPFISVPSLKNQSLKDLTTWRIGGYSTEVFFPATIEEIQRIVVHYRMLDRPLSVMGYGSNLLIDDRGFDGGIIVLKKNFCKHTLDHTDLLVLEAGFACPKLARLAWTMGFKNLAFLSGIPGSIGGAIQMNAGAHHHAIMDYVKKVEMIDT